ncbi:hypothetical protein F5876DRAFT_67946 [Lentinula aff. lateritia]|uniref:Uncharacterized protein n=1 Tax=Lentinula aff. lateritia TaxID=2804960 RepID=A0ACC1TT54_9AGAR|nr:hypothetical protein F5876DRAFT_67946 [Lentinula aff. lateritia]
MQKLDHELDQASELGSACKRKVSKADRRARVAAANAAQRKSTINPPPSTISNSDKEDDNKENDVEVLKAEKAEVERNAENLQKKAGSIITNKRSQKVSETIYNAIGVDARLSANEARYFMLNGSGIRKPELDKPLEALRYLRAAMDADQEQLLPGQERTYVDKAKETLSRIISDKKIDKSSQGMIFLSKIYLFRVLRRLGEEKDAQKHEQWLIKWLKRNSHCLPELTFVEIFTTYMNIKEDTVWAAKSG